MLGLYGGWPYKREWCSHSEESAQCLLKKGQGVLVKTWQEMSLHRLCIDELPRTHPNASKR
eukprot:5156925-Amphidinium_carterae.1